MATSMMSSSQPLPSPASRAAHPPRREDTTAKAQPPSKALEIVRLAAVNVTSLAIGFNDASSALLIESTIPETSLTPILSNALPFTIGTILAAAFLDPIARNVRGKLRYPYFVLALFSVLLTSVHGLWLILPLTWGSEPVPVSIIAQLLLGAGHSLGLTTVTLLCNGPTTKPGTVYGMVALGMLLRTMTGTVTRVETGRAQEHALVIGLAMLSANLLLCVVDCKHTTAAGDLDEERAVEAETSKPDAESGPILPREKTPPPSSSVSSAQRANNDHYPPAASRITIFAALFTFTHNAFVASIPAWLTSLSTTSPRTHDEPESVSGYHNLAALWTGLTIGRFLLALSRHKATGNGNRQQSLTVPRALLLTTMVLLLPALVPLVAGKIPVLAGVAGCLLGPVYPAAVDVFMNGLGEGEAVGGIGIVVAFGSSGAVAGLVVSQLIVQFSGMPVVLLLVVAAGLVGGMLLCWRALPDETGNVDIA